VTDVAHEPELQAAPLLQSALVVQVQVPPLQTLVAGDGPGQLASVEQEPPVTRQLPLTQ
jgi:hypothetical protein